MWDLIVSVPDHCLSFYFNRFIRCHMLRQCANCVRQHRSVATHLPQVATRLWQKTCDGCFERT